MFNMFNTGSALVIIWARNVKNENYTREQVPKLSNLREMVYQLLDADAGITPPVEELPTEPPLVDETPVEPPPIEEEPEQPPTEEPPTETIPTEETPVEEPPIEELPTEPTPSE